MYYVYLMYIIIYIIEWVYFYIKLHLINNDYEIKLILHEMYYEVNF